MPDGERLSGRVEPGDTVVAAIGPADLDTMRALFSPEFFIRRYSSIIAGARPGEKEDPFLCYLENVRDLVLDPCVELSERFYLMTNLDVNAAVKAGTFHCGFHHWVMHGCEEGRPGYDAATDGDDAQDLVLSTDSRLRALFEAEHYASRYFPGERLSEEEAFGRFLGGGMEQGQIPVPSTVFDENFYLCYYDDIREGKARGEIPSGFYHYAIAGSKEGRLPVYDMNRLLAAKLGELASPVLLSRTDSIEAKLAPLKTAIDPDRRRGHQSVRALARS